MTQQHNGSVVRRRILARQLRLLREQAGLTLEEAAPKLDWSAATLSRIETAQPGSRPRNRVLTCTACAACWTSTTSAATAGPS
ncbi:MAG: helix-turn-helix domain-containing protein [Pseudonocardia sp.]